MAFSAITARGSAVRAVSGASTSGNVNANIVVGRLLIIGCSTKNNATADGASTTHTSITDAAGNQWDKVAEYTETEAGAANDGTTVSIWKSIITTQINSGAALVVNHGTNNHGIITFLEATISSAGVSLEQLGVGQGAISAAVASMPSREYLLYACFGAEGSDQTKTPDADYAPENFDLRSANSATATTIHVQSRIATLTDDTCTSTAWTNTQPIALLAAFYEDPLTPNVAPAEAVKLADTVTAEFAVENLEREIIAENIKLSDEILPAIDLVAEPTEALKLADALEPALELSAEPTEALRVNDTVDSTLDPLEASTEENLKIVDVAEPGLEISAESTEDLKLADTVTAELDLIAEVSELIKLAEQPLARTLDPLEAAPAESLRIVDAGFNQTQLIGVIHITDEIFAEMGAAGDLSASAEEHLKLADALVAEFALEASLLEELRLADQVEVALDEEAAPAEALKLSDTVLATLDPLETSTEESVRLSKELAASMGELAAVLAEELRLADAIFVILDPEEASSSEQLKLSDEVTAVRDLTTEAVEELRLAEAASVALDPLEASASEALRPTDIVTASIQIDANVAEALKLQDAVQTSLDPLQASIGEALAISDILSTEGTLAATAAESLKLADNVQATLDQVAVLAESVRVVDELTPALELSTSVVEEVRVQDTLVVDLPAVAILQETVRVAEILVVTRDLEVVLDEEQLRITDTPTGEVTGDLSVSVAPEGLKFEDYFPRPCIIDLEGIYAPTIDIEGEYNAVLDVEGEYKPVLDVEGLSC